MSAMAFRMPGISKGTYTAALKKLRPGMQLRHNA
jgi:hypothetical protein